LAISRIRRVGSVAEQQVSSITIWGIGMVEFIVLAPATNQETIVSDKECGSAESLWRLLDDHIRDLTNVHKISAPKK
jgi:hypothetical protein